MSQLVQQFRRLPVVMTVLLLGAAGALLVDTLPDAIHWLTFQDFVFTANDGASFFSPTEALSHGQYWRLVTPHSCTSECCT